MRAPKPISAGIPTTLAALGKSGTAKGLSIKPKATEGSTGVRDGSSRASSTQKRSGLARLSIKAGAKAAGRTIVGTTHIVIMRRVFRYSTLYSEFIRYNFHGENVG